MRDTTLSLDFEAVEALTFDCYGTLIDWEQGLLAALRPVVAAHAISVADDELLELYARLEAELESGSYLPYREILTRLVDGFGRELGFEPSADERQALVGSIRAWPPFPDTVRTLRQLKARFKLGVISNIDDDLFTSRLEVDLDWLVTAQQAGAYKPAFKPFELALERMALPVSRVVHVAQSLYHDHVPAQRLGLRTVWVNRRAGQPGSGATPAADATPDLEVPTLAALADIAAPRRGH
jgi:2-haloacid dehalogenase